MERTLIQNSLVHTNSMEALYEAYISKLSEPDSSEDECSCEFCLQEEIKAWYEEGILHTSESEADEGPDVLGHSSPFIQADDGPSHNRLGGWSCSSLQR